MPDRETRKPVRDTLIRASWLMPCLLVLGGCFGDEGIDSSAGSGTGTGTGTGTSTSTSDTGDEPTGGTGGSTTGGVASPDCDAYLACVLEATPDAYGGAVAVYGPNSDCRNSTPQVAEDCEQACRAARDNLHETYPDAAACGEGEPATTGDAAGHTVSGSVALVNAPGDASTSVILVPTSSFSPMLPHSVAPKGPTALGVDGAWSIPEVPNGTYWLLVAYEDDGLVQDPEGFDGPAMVVVQGEDVVVEQTKVTAAITPVTPTGDEVIAGEPLFGWVDQAGEDLYQIYVVNEAGEVVWSFEAPGAEGVDGVQVKYGGPPLADGTYQLRVTAYYNKSALTRTEDLAGTFVVKN
jgi:hypothetical protein